MYYGSASEAHAAGQFSRRHQGPGPHREAQQRRHEREAARIDTIVGARQLRAARSNAQQIAELDRRLGKGIGAARERARLQANVGGRKRRRKGKKGGKA